MDNEVLIVGAGPTGLTLAAGLLQRGIRVRIIDKAADVDTDTDDSAAGSGPHSKAITLWPRALEAFQTLGAGTAMFDQGIKLAAASYYTGGRCVARVKLRPLAHTRFPSPISLPQTTTEQILRDTVTATGGRIEFGRSLQTLAQDGDGVLARLDDGEIVPAAWVVGCDGGRSTVREQTGVAFEGTTYPQTFLILDGEFDTDYAADESYYATGPTGVLVVVGLPGGLHRTFASVPPGQCVDDAQAAMLRLLAERSPLRIAHVRTVGCGTFRVHRKMAERMRIGRVLLAGDAAHVHSPAGGLGLNTGVQDAASLAWRLAGVLRADLSADELDAWAAERLFTAGRVLAETDAQTRLWMMRGWRRILRDLALGAGRRTGLIERNLSRRMAQFDLVLPHGGTRVGRLRPGGRMPDFEFGDGRRLHDVLSTRPLVVLGGPLPAGAHDQATVIDDPRIRRILRAPRGTVCSVRPDAVIVAVAPGPAGLAGLRSHFGAAGRTTQREETLR